MKFAGFMAVPMEKKDTSKICASTITQTQTGKKLVAGEAPLLIAEIRIRVSRGHPTSKFHVDMTSLQLALVLVASIWAAMNTLISGYTAVNAARDRKLADDHTTLRWFCYLAAMLPFGSFLGFFVLGIRDRNLIVKVLGKLSRSSSNGEADPPKGNF